MSERETREVTLLDFLAEIVVEVFGALIPDWIVWIGLLAVIIVLFVHGLT